jgi:DNA polymerase III subunit epsilon
MNDKKVFWFDIETTGLDTSKCGIVQLAGLVEINGKVEDEFDFKCKPFPGDLIFDEAIVIHGLTKEIMETFDDPAVMHRNLLSVLGKHCDKFDRLDKFYPAGYNVSFDYNFLQSFFMKNNDKFFGSWFNHRRIDPLSVLWIGDLLGKYNLDNYKLETVAKHFGVTLQAHNALSDVKATREIFGKIA